MAYWSFPAPRQHPLGEREVPQHAECKDQDDEVRELHGGIEFTVNGYDESRKVLLE